MKSIQLTKAIALTCALFALSACATKYHEYSLVQELTLVNTGGHSVKKVSDDRYLVQYEIIDSDPRDMVRKFLLYRSATLALDQGYDGFSWASDIALLKPPRAMTKNLWGVEVTLLRTPIDSSKTLNYDAQVIKTELAPFIAQHS